MSEHVPQIFVHWSQNMYFLGSSFLWTASRIIFSIILDMYYIVVMTPRGPWLFSDGQVRSRWKFHWTGDLLHAHASCTIAIRECKRSQQMIVILLVPRCPVKQKWWQFTRETVRISLLEMLRKPVDARIQDWRSQLSWKHLSFPNWVPQQRCSPNWPIPSTSPPPPAYLPTDSRVASTALGVQIKLPRTHYASTSLTSPDSTNFRLGIPK